MSYDPASMRGCVAPVDVARNQRVDESGEARVDESGEARISEDD